LWVGDVTEIPTLEGKLYLASVEDRFSGRLLGYATSAHHDAELACAALKMAAATRGGFDAIDGVVFHSDRGSEGGFNWSMQHFDVRAIVGDGSSPRRECAIRGPSAVGC
ncbi:DDE-type integrase/transposase/recombinase, partial [Nocardia amamiensis]|nr:DDE-type integrase/transposase/recombinase [Nocardia amamiensis]